MLFQMCLPFIAANADLHVHLPTNPMINMVHGCYRECFS